jgi:hypothetical protein
MKNSITDYNDPNDSGYREIIGIIKDYAEKNPELKCIKYKSNYNVNEIAEIIDAVEQNDVSKFKMLLCEPSGGKKSRKNIKYKKRKSIRKYKKHKSISKRKNKRKNITRKYYKRH